MPQQETAAACFFTHLTSYHKSSQLQGMVKGVTDEVAPCKSSQTDLVSMPGDKNANPTHAPIRPSPPAEPLSQADEASLLRASFQAAQPLQRAQIVRQEVSKVSS